MYILGIETSCDETSVGIIKDNEIVQNLIYSQSIHQLFGGVVPEIASRAHLQKVQPLLKNALNISGLNISDIDLICATTGPGLIGALIVGYNFGKALAYSYNKLFIPTNHIFGHLYSIFLESTPEFPMITLIISGGHSSIYFVKDFYDFEVIGSTIDDAAGEAFDKVGKMIGLNYPAGPEIESLAQKGDDNFIKFPVAGLTGTYNFSFSGIKTSVLRYIEKEKNITPEQKNHISASFQKSMAEILAKKIFNAAKEYKVKSVSVVGGVAANGYIRKKISEVFNNSVIKTYFPSKILCSDNGAMIAYAGYQSYLTKNYLRNPILSPFPN